MTDAQDEIRAEMRAALEGLLGEPVVAFGFFGQPGFIAGSYRSQMEPGGAGAWLGLKRLFGRSRQSKMPTQVFLAATPTRLAVLTWKRAGRTVLPKDVYATWERSRARVEFSDGPTGPIVSIQGSDEEKPVHLESSDVRKDGVNDAVLAELRR